MPEIVAEYIDRLCTVEMRRPGLPRGLARQFYEATLADAGEPLSLKAAKLLLESCKSGKPIFITCNAGGPPWLPHGETDGPIGGAVIARAVAVASGAVPMFVVSDYQAPPIAAAARVAGLVVTDPETALQRSSWGTSILSYNEVNDGTDTAKALIERYRPTALVAIETLGPNDAGVIHSVTGHAIPDAPAYHRLFEVATALNLPTVGSGDGGNEIGFGRILQTLKKLHPFGINCQCPCAKGGITSVSTDVLVFAAVSSWGAYGVAAMISLLSGDLGAFHDSETDRRMLEACLAAGAVDGGFANHGFTVDAIDGRISNDMVHMLRTMIQMATEKVDRPF